MQFLPTAADLAAAVARVLDEDIVGAVPDHLQHSARVAGHLANLLEREVRLGAATARRERELLAELLGTDAGDRATLGAELAERLRSGDDESFERDAWRVMVEITRADLAIAKPGHDAWEDG